MGVRQKLGLDKKEVVKGGTTLLKKWFKVGKLSASDVQEGAQCIIEGNSGDASLRRFANAGPKGTKHVSRNIVRGMLHECKSPELYSTSITLWDVEKEEKVEEQCHFLIPYETIDYEIDKAGGNIEDFCSLPPGSPWHAQKRTWMKDNGVEGDGSDIAIIGIWGDAAPYNTRDSLYMLLFSVISGVNHARNWTACFTKRTTCQCGCFGRCTFASLWRFWSWVATSWMAQVLPTIRDDGVPFDQSNRVGDKNRAKRAR